MMHANSDSLNTDIKIQKLIFREREFDLQVCTEYWCPNSKEIT